MLINHKLLALIFVSAALSFASACVSSTADSSKSGNNKNAANVAQTSPSPAMKYQLPADIVNAEMKTLDGKTVRLSDYYGKVVLVNQWAAWCGPCRMETPELVKISQEMQDKDIVIIGMTIADDRGNNETSVKNFVKQQQVPYQIVWATDNVWSGLADISGTYSIPQSYIINRNGEVTAVFSGFSPVRTPKGVRHQLELALAQN